MHARIRFGGYGDFLSTTFRSVVWRSLDVWWKMYVFCIKKYHYIKKSAGYKSTLRIGELPKNQNQMRFTTDTFISFYLNDIG